MKQASRFDGLSLNPFSLVWNGLPAAKVDVGRCQVLQALVVSLMVVMVDEAVDLVPEVPG